MLILGCLSSLLAAETNLPPAAMMSTNSFNVRDFGAKGDGQTKDTAAVQKALDACAAHGGGNVMVPAGSYLIGSVVIGANTTLQLAHGANLLGSPDLVDYPLVRGRWEGEFAEIHRALISRLKILCSINITESRFPQDGRFSMAVGGGTTHFRVSMIPTLFGEKSVVRILATTGRKSMVTLDKMMISQTILQPFRRLIQNPNGIVFVTGPTGSGKTTTLYAALHEINKPDLNISTIEDPVEIQLAGLTQSQVNAHIDLKFSTLLRALLRQDPDIILIGEIRDLETAKIATEAALTGHLVFATLHTNTAAQAIVRLLEIGVEPFMVAPSIIGVLAQRLVARICEHCKEAYYPPPETLRRYFLDDAPAEVPFYRGRGCPKCRGTGYKGRIAFHELVLITEEIRTMISEGRSAQEITRTAAKVGYRPLRYDGLKKVLLGLTTIEEIEQNTSFEWAQ